MSVTDSNPTADTTIDDCVTTAVGDDDHYLRHVTPEDMTFSGRHERHLETTVDKQDGIIHTVTESYSRDAHGGSVAWTRGVPSGDCPFCDEGSLTTETGESDSEWYIEMAECDSCPYEMRRASVDAPFDDPAYRKPVFYRATIPHNFDSDNVDVDWEEMREKFVDNDTDISDIANLVRTMSIRRHVGVVRDSAYDSDERELQTIDCGHCGSTIDTPAAKAHTHYGDVCPDCEDVTIWSIDDAELPDDVGDKMDTHASFTPEKVRTLLRDVLYYAPYKRTNMDEEKAESVIDGITTGRGGKRDAHGMGRGTKGTGLRRPNGAFHGDAHWRTVLSDAQETGLIERIDENDCDDTEKNARWIATTKGREVFGELARCSACGEQKSPYNRVRTYQERGRYTKKSSNLTLACSECDQMSSTQQGMVLASSTGQFALKELDG